MAMKKFRTAPIFIAVSCLLLVMAGCIFGPDDEKSDNRKDTFKPLTDKENVLYNLVKSYEEADIDHFIELLHTMTMYSIAGRETIRSEH